jgi:hypothetical protein
VKKVLSAVSISMALMWCAFAQQPSLSQLRQQVAELESRWNDYPALRSSVAPDLRTARLNLIERLQKDLAYFAEKAQKGDNTVKTELDRIAKEIQAQNEKLISDAGQPVGKAPSTVTATRPTPKPQTAPGPSAPKTQASPPTTPITPQAPVPANKTERETEVPKAGGMAVNEFTPAPEPVGKQPEITFTDPKVLTVPAGFTYAIDISRDFGGGKGSSPCSNRGFGQEASVWKIIVMVAPLVDGKAALTAEDSLFLEQDGKHLNIVTLERNDQIPRVTLIRGASSIYEGHLQNYARAVSLVFDNKTLAQATDIVDLLSRHPEQIKEALNKDNLQLNVYQLAFDSANGPFTKIDLYNALTFNIDAKVLLSTLKDAAASGKTLSIQDDTNEKLKSPLEVRVKKFTPVTGTPLAGLLNNLELDGATVRAAKANLSFLIDHQTTSKSTNAPLANAAKTAAKSEAGDDTADNAPAPKVLNVIDNPCYQVSAAPLLNGGSGLQPAASFKFRYDYYAFGDALVIKLRGEGEGSASANYFQRIKVTGEPTIFLVKETGGLQIVGGGLSSYSFTRPNGNPYSEWRAGGKLELKTPALRLFNQLAGADSKPTFGFEGGASGVDTGIVRTTDYDFRGKFAFTLRASPKISLDLNSAAGISNTKRFANSRDFAFVDLRGRYNFSSDFDYVVHYQCGRQDPDYKKFCGWQTGFAYVTGR